MIVIVVVRKFWRMLYGALSLGTPENSAIQKLSIIIIVVVVVVVYLFLFYFVYSEICV